METVINRRNDRFRLFFIKLQGNKVFRLRELYLPLRLDFDSRTYLKKNRSADANTERMMRDQP
ncbi:MAG: hypothetical protein DWQ53_12100 [Microcystis flos-aquae DF17]|nr:MAG: hypothetical protein DWQ53_12100 [Microcystis flos-aquae DF17]